MARNKKKERKPNAPYELPTTRAREHDMCVLSLDPGSRNFGIACVGIKDGKVRILANSLLTNPLNSVVGDLAEARRLFVDELDLWVKRYKPKAIIAERFQARGLLGPLAECVSVMLGIIQERYSHLPVRLLTAATWKNAHGRRFGKESLDFMYKHCLTQAHPLDAALIGVYGITQGLGKELKYSEGSVIAQMQHTSLLPLRKIKIKKEK